MSGAVLLAASCVTPVNERTPEEIAQRSFPVVDSYTGLQQLRSPSITQGGWARGTTATVYLQSAEPYQNFEGGAWLDVGLLYETPSANPAEMRVYNRARWAGGEKVLLADFSATVLSCEDRMQDVSPAYGNGYYGAGYYGGGNARREREGYGRRGDSRRRRGDRPRRDRDDGTDTGGGDDRPDRPRPGSDNRSVTDKPVVYRRPVGDVGGTPPPRRRDGRRASPTTPTSLPVPQSVSPPKPAPVSRPAPVVQPAPAPKPKSRPKPKPRKPTISRRRNDAEVLRFQDPRLAVNVNGQKADNLSLSQTRNGAAVTINYRGYNRGDYPRSYYGGGFWSDYGPTNYVVTSSCRRREDMRVYVPRDLLQRAQGGQGLVLLLRGQNGGEREVHLSTNYITGFSMAQSRYDGLPRQISEAPN